MILTFHGGQYPVPMCEEDEESARERLAVGLRDVLSRLGCELDDKAACYDEGLGLNIFQITINEQEYKVTFGVFPIGEEFRPSWAVSFIPRIHGVLSRNAEPIGDLLQRELSALIESDFGCLDCRWWNNEEFQVNL